jgi:hypothetical protein
MGPTKSHTQRVPGTLSTGVKRRRREADVLPASSDVVLKQIGGGGVLCASKCSDGSGSAPVAEIFSNWLGGRLPIEKTESMEKLTVVHLGNIFVISYET